MLIAPRLFAQPKVRESRPPEMVTGAPRLHSQSPSSSRGYRQCSQGDALCCATIVQRLIGSLRGYLPSRSSAQATGFTGPVVTPFLQVVFATLISAERGASHDAFRVDGRLAAGAKVGRWARLNRGAHSPAKVRTPMPTPTSTVITKA